MEKNKFIKYQLSVIFLLIIFVPIVLHISGIKGFERKDENRAFKDSISININKLDNFPEEFESYANDNFYFRSPMLDFFHGMKFNLFRISPHPEKGIIGKDGWMFKSGEELEVLSGEKNFSEETLDAFKNEWKERTEYLNKRNIPVYWIIAPMKHSIYPEKLPYNLAISETNRIEQLKTRLNSDFPDLIIDPTSALLKKKKEKNVYYKLDNHWNDRAGYLTTELLLKKLRRDFPNKNIPEIPEIKWNEEKYHGGYLHDVMGIEDLNETLERAEIQNPQSTEGKKFGFESVPGFAYPWDYENYFINKSINNGLRVLIIRDSFGQTIIPFVRELFSESLLIFDAWEYKLNEEIIEKFNPDVVIYLGLETHMGNFIKDYKKVHE